MGMDNLVKLQLDNNIITKIKGLGTLKQLKWLDLSFNSIETIEGLDECLQISDLSLYSNHIRSLSGLENLKELNVLSVGKNRLSDLEHTVKYLMSLKNKLEVLKIAGNNFQARGEKEYHKYTIAHLKQLKYLDYELITSTNRTEANEEHKEEMQDAENETDGDKADPESGSIDPELTAAKIGITVNIFQNAINSLSEEELKLIHFQRYGDIYQTSDGQIEDFTQKYQTDMKFKNREKQRIIKFCIQQLQDAERKAERESIQQIEAYKKVEKHAYRDIEKTRDKDVEPDYDKVEQSLEGRQKGLYGALLDIEINLQDALLTARKTYFSKVSALNEEMRDLTAVYINQDIMVEIEQFANKFIEAVMQEKERIDNLIEQDADIEELEKDYEREFLEVLIANQKEDMQSIVQTFKENLTAKFSSYETIVSNSIIRDWKDHEDTLREGQQARNRAIIQEIVATCDKLKEDMRKCTNSCDPV